MAPVVERVERLRQSSLGAWINAWIAVCFLLTVPVNAAEQKTTAAPKAAAPPAPVVIPVAQVATRATEVTDLLRSFDAKFASDPAIETIDKSLPDVDRLIELELAGTTDLLDEQPSLELLQTQQQLWQRRQLQTAGWLNLLTERATQLQNAQSQLARLRKTWTTTRAAAAAAKAPEPILQQIDATRASLEAAQVPLQKRRVEMLDLQSRVASKVAVCNTVLARIGQSQQRAVVGILVRDGPPIWSAELWTEALNLLPERAPKVAARYRADMLRYLLDPAAGMPWHAALFIVLAIGFSAARRRSRKWDMAGESASSELMVLDHPYAAALLVTLLLAGSPYAQMPTAVRQMFQILALAPTILLTRRIVDARMVPGLYALALFFIVDTLRQPIAAAPLIGQATLILESFVGLVVGGWLLRTSGRSRLNALRLVIFFFILIFVVGLMAGSLGYVRLANLLVSGIFAAGGLALTLYASVQVLSGLMDFLLCVWPLRLLRMVQHNRDLLQKRAYHLILLLAIGGWLARYLDYVGLLEPVSSSAKTVLAAKLDRGSISVSVEDLLAFVVTVWVAYLLSAFIRFVLQEDVYPRMNLAPGQSYAASSLLNYIILALGFVAALGVLGVDFSKVSILAGALGVGIGFGLQSVVNNFVSGLILLFERPIKVGDVVQVGTIQGKVNRIGMRASIVGTFQGAEIIVPNAQLITQEVTNWTRSDQLRRVDLPVGVSYGTVPKKMIELLESVARAHPEVLPSPAPWALFMGYGDSSINFELRVWTEFTRWVQVHSDLTVAVYDAVHAADMSFPFPQREVRLLRDPEPDSNGDSAAPAARSAARSDKDKLA